MKDFPRRIKSLLVLGLSLQIASCGTIMHPERKGQAGGRLDVGVVILDGVGLFFFIIPGVIAYAVDFSNGTIYLPGTGVKLADGGRPEFEAIKFDAGERAPESVRRIIRADTGYDLDWRDRRLLATRLESREELSDRFAEAVRTVPSQPNLDGGR